MVGRVVEIQPMPEGMGRRWQSQSRLTRSNTSALATHRNTTELGMGSTISRRCPLDDPCFMAGFCQRCPGKYLMEAAYQGEPLRAVTFSRSEEEASVERVQIGPYPLSYGVY